MKRKQIFATVILVSAGLVLPLTSCSRSKKNRRALPELTPAQKNHVWYYFTDTSFSTIDLPQHAPEALEKPWTEAVRISSAGSVPSLDGASYPYQAYALVNHAGILALKKDGMEFFSDASIFAGETADSLVFSKSVPVFYFYKSTFFNQLNEPFSKSSETVQKPMQRPFLVEFNPSAKLFFPLVSYENLHLAKEDQITGFVWNGKTWACSAKRKPDANRFEFSYFTWEPYVQLSELSPALNTEDMLLFNSSTEDEYKKLILPKLYNSAPQKVKDLLSSREIENIFENSDFIYMLNQAGGDRQILAKQLNISPHQLSFVTNSNEGEGLLFYGNTIIPFKDKFPKDTKLYKIMTTKPQEMEGAGDAG